MLTYTKLMNSPDNFFLGFSFFFKILNYSDNLIKIDK